MPVIKGEKTAGERFPGAVDTYTHRSDDAGPQGAAGRHVALPRPEFLEGPGDQVPDRSRRAGVRLDDQLGRVDAADRRADHDALRRRRPGAAAEAGAGARRDPADLPQRRREGAGAAVLRSAASTELAAQQYDGEPVRVRHRRPRPPRRREEVAMGQARRAAAAGDRPARHRRRHADARPPRLGREAGRRSPATSSSPTSRKLLAEIQQSLFDRAAAAREAATREDRQPRRVREVLHAQERRRTPKSTAAWRTATSSTRRRWTRSSRS